jgi:hypothetical protein
VYEDRRQHKRVPIDTSVWICHFEQHPQLGLPVGKVIESLEAGKFRVREHLENVANICNLVFQFFNDDVKTKLWFQTPSPMLGNMSPRDMIRLGRYNKLLRFVTQAMEEGVG